ncbi:MAG: EAL domain-containing protein [Steroidobacteraceae bacterium]
MDILEQLSRMGVVISVDDFGTGYSSMSYLRRFPIDKPSTASAVETMVREANAVEQEEADQAIVRTYARLLALTPQ